MENAFELDSDRTQQEFAELQVERDFIETAIIKRAIEGMTTLEDARYIAWSFGKLDQLKKELGE